MKNKILITALLAVGCFTSLSFAATQQPPGVTKAVQGAAKTKLTPAERGDLAYEIIKKWGNYIQIDKKMSIDDWTDRMLLSFVNADASNLQSAAKAHSFDAMVGALLGQRITPENVDRMMAAPIPQARISRGGVAVKAAGGSTKMLGSPLADLVYTPLPNGRCRIADSRALLSGAGSPLAAAGQRNLVVWGTSSYSGQGGNGTYAAGDGSTNCGIPSNPVSVAVSVTVLPQTSNAGVFKVFQQGLVFQTGNTVFYSNGGGASGDLIVRSCIGCGTEISVYSSESVHYVVDVIGYYMPPVATALQCVETANTDLAISASGGTGNAVAPACATGYTQTATNCETTSWLMPIVYFQSGTCSARNGDTTSQTLRASRTCCRVPGR
jgi:hypothetical protein